MYDAKQIGNNLDEKEIKNKIWEDIKKLNNTLPTYKYIKNLFISEEPMIKTTTSKIKRNEEIKKILEGC